MKLVISQESQLEVGIVWIICIIQPSVCIIGREEEEDSEVRMQIN